MPNNFLLLLSLIFLILNLLVLSFDYICFILLRKAISNIAFSVNAFLYIPAFILFNFNACIPAGCVSFLAVMCTIIFYCLKNRIYVTQGNFTSDLLKEIDCIDTYITYNNKKQILVIRGNYKPIIKAINKSYKAKKSMLKKPSLFSLIRTYLYIPSMCVVLYLYLMELFKLL